MSNFNSNTTILYRYKIFNNSLFSVKENQENIIYLEENGSIEINVNNSSVLLNQTSENNNLNVAYNYSTGINCYLKASQKNSLFGDETNSNKNKNSFYIYSFVLLNSGNINETELFFVDANSISYSDIEIFMDETEWVFTLNTISHLENINDGLITFRLAKDKREFITFQGEKFYINLIFDDETLVNNVDIVGIDGLRNVKNSFIPYKVVNSHSLAFFVPYEVSKNKIELYSPTFDFKNGFSLYFLYKNNYRNSFSFKDDFLKNDSIKAINDVLENCAIMLSGYKGMTKEQIEEFKKNIFGGTDPKKYADYVIQTHINSLNVRGLEIESLKFQSVILSLSEYIPSNWAWKGGLTFEHKAGMLFYLEWLGGETKLFNLRSKYIKIENKQTINEVDKLLPLSNGYLPLPQLPDKLESQEISNSPVDYNMGSFNLNYIFYIEKDYNYYWEKIVVIANSNIEPEIKTYNTYFYDFIDVANENYLHIKNENGLLDAILRHKHNIPNSAELIPDSLKVSTGKFKELFSDESYAYDTTLKKKLGTIETNGIVGKYKVYQNSLSGIPLKPFVLNQYNEDFINIRTGALSLEIQRDVVYNNFDINKIIIKSIKGKNVLVNISDKPLTESTRTTNGGFSFYLPLAQKNDNTLTTTEINIKDYMNFKLTTLT